MRWEPSELAAQAGDGHGSWHARIYNLQARRLQQLTSARGQEAVQVGGCQHGLASSCGRVDLEQAAAGDGEQAAQAPARRCAPRAARQAGRHMLDEVPARHCQAGHLPWALLSASHRTPANIICAVHLCFITNLSGMLCGV